ncbi:galactose metabolism- protein [Blastocladiella emersonii ATCC 22665]|nr:galactose metabolism- protein [Blastocladiella emersonii ATCC 22665]
MGNSPSSPMGLDDGTSPLPPSTTGDSRPLSPRRHPSASASPAVRASPRPAPLNLANGRPPPTQPIALPSPRIPNPGYYEPASPAPIPMPAAAAAAQRLMGASPFVGSPLSYASTTTHAGGAAATGMMMPDLDLAAGGPAGAFDPATGMPLLALPPDAATAGGATPGEPSEYPDMLSPPQLPSVDGLAVAANMRLPSPLSPTAGASGESALSAAIRKQKEQQQQMQGLEPLPAPAAKSPRVAPTPAPATTAPATVPTTIRYVVDTLADPHATGPPSDVPSAVYITGTFNQWRSKVPLRRGNDDNQKRPTFAVTLALAPGVYRLKFIVDDEWRCCRQLPTAQDEDGNLVNFVEVQMPPLAPSPVGEVASAGGRARAQTVPASSVPAAAFVGAAVAAAARPVPVAQPVAPATSAAVPAAAPFSASVPNPLPPRASALAGNGRTSASPSASASPPPLGTSTPPPSSANQAPLPPLGESPPGEYSTQVPSTSALLRLASHPPTASSASAAAAASNGTGTPTGFVVTLGPTGEPVVEPPALPAHLTKVLLNAARPDEESVPVPPHVVLNHLYACSIRDGVMAVAITARYRKKHVTTVVYRPVSI